MTSLDKYLIDYSYQVSNSVRDDKISILLNSILSQSYSPAYVVDILSFCFVKACEHLIKLVEIQKIKHSSEAQIAFSEKNSGGQKSSILKDLINSPLMHELEKPNEDMIDIPRGEIALSASSGRELFLSAERIFKDRVLLPISTMKIINSKDLPLEFALKPSITFQKLAMRYHDSHVVHDDQSSELFSFYDEPPIVDSTAHFKRSCLLDTVCQVDETIDEIKKLQIEPRVGLLPYIESVMTLIANTENDYTPNKKKLVVARGFYAYLVAMSSSTC